MWSILPVHQPLPGPRSSGGTVLGADGCPGGRWVVAEVALGGQQTEADAGGVRWHLVPGADALLELAARPGVAALAADVPIGLPEAGPRDCDVLARRRLRGGGAASVFAAPPRAVLGAGTYAEARRWVPSLSAQTFALVERIADVDRALRAAGPQVHERVVECHPEVSLRALTGRALPRKRSAPGALLRLRALERAFGPVPEEAPGAAALDDALDALACAWTALRWARGTAEVLGGGLDAAGTPMRIVV